MAVTFYCLFSNFPHTLVTIVAIGLFECESYREARNQMWRYRMLLVGSIIVWLAVLIVVNLQLGQYQVVSVLEPVGGIVVLVSAVLFYFANEEMQQMEDGPGDVRDG